MKIVKSIMPYVIIILVVILLRIFIVTPVMVNGDSMNDTLVHNQIILLKKFDRNYSRNEIIVFEHNDSRWVKRVIGLPGETVECIDDILYINGNIFEDRFASTTTCYDLIMINLEIIPPKTYFVLGDNRSNSSDSRTIGVVSEDKIVGTTSFSLWPIRRIN